MDKKIFWWLAFGVVAALSCWATATSFMMIIPLPWYVIWAMTIVFFAFASFAFKLVMDGSKSDGSVDNRKLKLWGGLALLLLTWVVISLPTNAHTFFYKLQIGNVVTEDLKTTEVYASQLANREYRAKPDTTYPSIAKFCNEELKSFEKEATGTGPSGHRFIDKYSLQYIANLNAKLGTYGNYKIPLPNTTRTDESTRIEIENAKKALAKNLAALENEFKVDKKYADASAKDIEHISAMQVTIESLVQLGRISHPSSDSIIKQAEGVLILAYSNIKMNEQYVRFNNADDEELYTAPNLETRTSRFLHPYKVMGDFFTGKIPFIFVFWIILSILLDVLGFISFDLALKDEYDF